MTFADSDETPVTVGAVKIPHSVGTQNMNGSGNRKNAKDNNMLIAIVEIPMARKATKQDAIDRAKKAAPTYVDLGQKGLIRKYFLNGDTSGGGVYLWESRQAAEAWYTTQWYDWIEERFGARPKLTMFDNYVVVDNLAAEVRIDGEAWAPAL